jgi:hypothetical protein
VDEGDNLLDNTNIHNVEGDNTLSLGLQPLTTGSALEIRLFLVRFIQCDFHTGNMLSSSAKQTFKLCTS